MKRLVSFIHEQSGETKNRKPAELSAPRSWHEIIEKAQAILHHAANAEGKRATLTVTGSEPRLTPIAIIAVGDAFVHLIRNAVAHGIPAGGEGQVRLSVRADGRDWVIEIDDDGNGVELAALEQQAIRQGLRSPDSSLKPREAAELLFQPGFTTASGGISAGRGIGMSAVRSSIRSVGGTVDVDLPTGSGVKVILRVPSAP